MFQTERPALLMIVVLSTLLMSVSKLAEAHVGAGEVGGLAAGFMHPILGWDHVVEMVAVGLWGAFLGHPSLWILPIFSHL